MKTIVKIKEFGITKLNNAEYQLLINFSTRVLCGENQSAYERDKGFALDCAHRRGGGGGAAIRVAVEQLPAGEGEPADEGERGVPRRFAGRDVPPDGIV